MAKTIDYSLQLSDIAAPQAGAQGELLLAAGATEGAAAATRGKSAALQTEADTGAISFLGTTAIAAAKGKMESDLGKDIQGNLDKLEDVGTSATQAQSTLAYLRSPEFTQEAANQLTIAQEEGADPAVIKEYTDTLKKIVAAQEQGIMTNTEVRNRIGAAVKQYSAAMPGWAPEFRKLGAEMTGISNIDTFGIHQALTQKSARDKANERAQEVQLQLDKEIASEQGVPLNGVTDAMRQRHFQSQQMTFGLAQMKKKMEGKQLVQTVADESYGQMVDISVSKAVVDFGQRLDALTKLHGVGTQQGADKAAQAGLELSGYVAQLGIKLEQEARGYTNPSKLAPGTTPMSVPEAEKRILAIRGTVKELQDGIKTVEGRNMLTAMVKNAEGNLNMLMSNFQVANFQLAALNRIGVLPSGVAQAFITLPRAEFQKQFGADLTSSFINVMKNPQAHANVMVNAAVGNPVNLSSIASYDPNLAKVAAQEFVTNIDNWAKDPTPPTKERLNAFSNTFAGFYSNHGIPANQKPNFNPNVPRDLDAAYSTLKQPSTQKMFGLLDQGQRANALNPMLVGIENTIIQNGVVVKAAVEKWNDPETSIAARAGWRVELTQNPLTGAFELTTRKSEERQPIISGSAGLPNGLVHRPGAFGGTSAPTTAILAADAQAELTRAQGLVNTLNKQMETYMLGTKALLPDTKANINEIRNVAFENIRTGNGNPLVQDARKILDTEVVPKSTPAAPVVLDADKLDAAIRFAERSHTHDNFKESDAGARGPHQFMPDTAKRFGLKVDKAAGIDERTDPLKSKPAAVKYIAVLHKMFEGDMAKVAAAYNAGEGNVQQAVEKAKDLGVPEDWRTFLPRPKETLPYIKRFLEKYNTK